MIIEMFKDIRVFLLIFFISVCAFSSFYFALDKENEEKVTEFEKGTFVDAVLYTYMQALGELGNDNFESSEKPN